MEDEKQANLQKCYDTFASAIRGRLYWQWDEGFETALAAVSVKDQDDIHGVFMDCLPNIWTGATINHSDEATRQVAAKFGGLKNHQRLYTSDTQQEAFLFAVWWPWDSGDRISIRVAPAHGNLGNHEYRAAVEMFKTSIGIA